MPISEILFFCCALGAFFSICLSMYLFLQSKNPILPNSTAALILFLIGIRVSISCVYFFSFKFPFILVQLGLIAHLLSGLLLMVYFYDHWGTGRKRKLLFSGLGIILLFIVAFPFDDRVVLWDHRIRYIIHVIVFSCIAVCLISFNRKNFMDIKGFNKRTILIFYILYCICFSISLFTTYSFGPFSYSFLVFSFVAYYLYSMSRTRTPRNKYANKKLSNELTQKISSGLQEYLILNKNFTNPNLKISEVAEYLNITVHQLSQYLNHSLKINFSNYINRLRIEEAKILLIDRGDLTTEGVGFESGFNSRSSFFTTFKKFTNVTPSKYKKSQMSSTL